MRERCDSNSHHADPSLPRIFPAQVKNLSLEDRFQFAMAPCNTRNPHGMAELLKLARSYSAREPLSFSSTWIEEVPRSSEELKLLEEKYQVPHTLCPPPPPFSTLPLRHPQHAMSYRAHQPPLQLPQH